MGCHLNSHNHLKIKGKTPRAAVICFALLLALSGAVGNSFAQHQLSPEAWIEMRKMYRAKIQPTTAEEEIAALAGHKARQAGPRLIDRGPAILPDIHKALLAPDLEPRQALGLLQIIKALADESSVTVILQLLGRDPQSPLRRDALLVLAILPATPEAASYITSLAANRSEPWTTYRMAFTWFGLHRDSRGRRFAEKLRNDVDPERRTTGLYVLARLGDRSVLKELEQVFKEGAPANSRDALLMSIAELTTPEEFKRIAPESLAWSHGYKNSMLYSRFRAATKEEKPAICLEMTRSSYPGHLTLAVRCLLDSGHADDLRPLAAMNLEAPGREALIRNEIRRAGWQVIDNDNEFLIMRQK
jgi:hypothetical protein